MPSSFILNARSPTAFGTSVTDFMAVAATHGAPDTTEANRQITYRTAGTASGLLIDVVSNTITKSSTLTFRIGGVNQTQTVSIAASTSGELTDPSHTDAVAASNKLSYELVTGNTGTSMNVPAFGITFNPTAAGTTYMRYAMTGGGSFSSASTTNYGPLVGSEAFSATEAPVQAEFRSSITLQNFYLDVSANARTTATTFGTRIGGVNGNLIVSVGNVGTGIFEDTTHTDVLLTGNLANFYITSGTGTLTLTYQEISVEATNTSGCFQLVAGQGSSQTITTTVTNYTCPQGLIAFNGTESNMQVSARIAFTASNYNCLVNTNTITAATTSTLRGNAGNGKNTISIASTLTGLFEDTTHIDPVLSTDKIDYQVITGGTGTSIGISQFGLRGTILPTGVGSWESGLQINNQPILFNTNMSV